MSLKRSILTLGLITAAGVVFYLAIPETTPPSSAQKPHHGCHFEPEDGFLFSIKQSGSTDQNQRALGNQAGFKGEGSSISNAMTLSGTMLWELHLTTGLAGHAMLLRSYLPNLGQHRAHTKP